jgi:acyl-CoA synthetase (AMP-forming)/AMP-acid ligase II
MNETKDTIPRRLWRNNETGNLENALRLLYMDRKDESLDYRTLISKAGGWRALYSASGLQTGDRIAIILRHSAALYASFIGAILGGFVPSLFAFPSPKFSKEEYFRTIGLLVDNAQCRLLVTYPELKKELEAENGILPGGVRIDAPETVQEASIEKDELPDDDPDSIAFIQYSSGTTGLKKGVAISHRALLWQVDRYADAIRLGPEDVIVSWLPTYHDMGLIACLMLPILKKTRLVAMSPFDWVKRPGMWPKAVTEHRGTLSWMPNFAYNFMARSVPLQELKGCDLSSVRGLVNCAEPILAESHRALLDRLGPFGLREGALCVSYAMAENTFAVTSSGFGEKLVEEVINGPNSVGRERLFSLRLTKKRLRPW